MSATQPNLFGTPTPGAYPRAEKVARTEQDENLERVSSRIAYAILVFIGQRRPGVQFRMAELVAYVVAAVPGTAPDSASRILRELRTAGKVRCRVVSRRGSLYEVG